MFCIPIKIVNTRALILNKNLTTTQVAPADFAMNMDLVTERSSSAKPPGTTSAAAPILNTLLGQAAPMQTTGSGGYSGGGNGASASDQAAIEKAAKWYRNAAGAFLKEVVLEGNYSSKKKIILTPMTIILAI